MKKIIKAFVGAALVLAASMNFSCKKNYAEEKKSIVCLSFAEYDWVKNILGERAGDFDLCLLQNHGMDTHSYQASVADIAKISKADLFIYGGGESCQWVESVLSNSANKNQSVISMMEFMEDHVLEEEFVEGMQAEENEAEENAEMDEHLWLSLRNAALLCQVLCNEISALDENNAATYRSNLNAYVKQLEDLDLQYCNEIALYKNRTLVFADRFPFRYFTQDYGLEYFAAFPGCSAESEASFETIIFLASKIDEYNLNSVLKIEKASSKIAETVIQNTKSKTQNVLELDSMQSVVQSEIDGGKTYLSVMKKNLDVLKQALN